MVEGADVMVLRGALETLRRSPHMKLLMDVDVRSEEERAELFSLLKSLNFELFYLGQRLVPIQVPDEELKEVYAVKVR